MSRAYYNEFDPGAAAWLRELIAAGLIAPGDVDERSILDVRPADLAGYTQCHFFAGIGGWSYALRLAGWSDDRPVWTGSPPCQPFSAAGQQLGKDDPRHLSPHFISLVRGARPGVLFGEQVASSDVFGKPAKQARGNFVAPPQWAWLDDLSDRLEAARYAFGASDFPSAGVGAPHIRQRTFFGAVSHEWLADSDGQGCGWNEELHARGRADQGQRGDDLDRRRNARRLVNSQRAGLEGHGGHGDRGHEPGWLDAHAAGSVAAPSTDGRMADQSRGGRREERADCRGRAAGDRAEGIAAGLGAGRGDSGLADADCRERQRIADGQGCQSDRTQAGWQQGDGQPAASGQLHDTSPLHGFWRDADWLFCRDGKWRPVEPGTFPLAHGVSGRVGLLRGYGNAINPHAAAQFIQGFTETAEGMRAA